MTPVHNRADHFAKSVLYDALSGASIGVPETEVEVVTAAQRIDVYAVPDPARGAERTKMGWLGELFIEPSLFEPFSGTPNLVRARRVICKQHVWHRELERRARAQPRASEPEPSADVEVVPFPWLIVISTGRPATVLQKYGCKRVRPGWHEAVEGLQMRVIVLAALPRRRETLMLRLLGAGPVLADALDDLAELPNDAWERSVTWPILIKFGMASEAQEPETEEKEVDVNAEIRAWYAEYERKREEKQERELREAEAVAHARDVLTVLRARGIAVSDEARERIQAEKSPERLERWLEKAAVAASLAEVLDEPS